jgi:FAD/FMN-containing dehydrogenase
LKFEVEDASGFRGQADAVYAPASEDELIALMRDASDRRIPVTIAGAGTGVTGGRVPLEGWSISLERFNTLEIGRGEAHAGAGVLLRDLQAACARSRQFYAPDPTEQTACVGGSIATNASGSRGFRYGATRLHVLALRVAFMDGLVREFRRGDRIEFDVPAIRVPRTTKNAAGFPLAPGMDWVDLFAGSEGTLAVVTEAHLKLLPAPDDLLTGVVFFETDDAALDAVDRWRRWRRLRMLEYMDAPSLELLRPAWPDIPRRAAAALLIEDEGDIDAWIDEVPDDSWFAASDRDRERFRRFRHALPEAVNQFVRSRALLKMGSDCAVPVDSNRQMLAFYRARLQEHFPERHVIFGHIGDAHLHANMLPSNEHEAALARDILLDFAREAVRLGGTVSAEHGLGKRKAHLLEIQYTPEDIDAMRSVKRRLDPQWLLGRGNLFMNPV